jgi:hypothetical protein
VKKRLSRRLTRFAGDGCLKIEMSNDSAGRAPLGQTRSAARVFSLVPAPEDGRAAIISTLIETANLNDVAGVLSSSRSREAFENGHSRRIALYISRVRSLALEWHAGGRRSQANPRRGRESRRSFIPAWRRTHERRSGLSGVRHAVDAPAEPAGARQLARSIWFSSRPLPRSSSLGR